MRKKKKQNTVFLGTHKTCVLESFGYTVFLKVSCIVSRKGAGFLNIWNGQQDLLERAVSQGSRDPSLVLDLPQSQEEQSNWSFPPCGLLFSYVMLPFMIQGLWMYWCAYKYICSSKERRK
jgi:hypothetical protein